MAKSKKKEARDGVHVRLLRADDITLLVELNKAAYPTMAEENVVWGETHLLSHLRQFPEGQFVAEVAGKIVGACSSLIVNLGSEPLRNHTWSGITDSGYFTNHDPQGDTLYGADVYVHPETRGLGVGAALYAARRELCKRKNLRRILAGGRLWNYIDYADRYSPEEYAARVVAGEIRDLVLSFQLREGFSFRGVMPNYLRDPRSKNNSSLIEWLNPDYRPPKKGPRKVRVACVQYQMRKIKSFKGFARQVEYFVDVAGDYGSDYVLFPELFTVQLLSQVDALSPQEGMKKLAEYTPRLIEMFRELSMKYGLTIIGGSHPVFKGDKLENICHVFLPDGRVIEQPKLHITPNERKWWGITGGDRLVVIDTPGGARIGVSICYDVEFPELVRYLADEGIEILFVPFCTDNRQGYLRVRLCAHARAIENQIYVCLAGNVGNLPDVTNMDVQYGQAAVLTPSDFPFARDGIAAEADANEETVLICDLDLDDLMEARHAGTVTPRLDRRPDMFQQITVIPGVQQKHRKDNEGPLGDQKIVNPVDPLLDAPPDNVVS
ncbi:MAG: bifunctional GNAT family N-acetyltransferase/carbon-nitrogen hydrolase family protein [Zavarzinella sp.]